jgi:hypothetical protein
VDTYNRVKLEGVKETSAKFEVVDSHFKLCTRFISGNEDYAEHLVMTKEL